MMRKGTQPVLKRGVCAVVIRAATLYRPCRNGECVHAELSERSVELLIHLSQQPQRLAVCPQRLRYRPPVELIDEHAAIVVIRILETYQGEHGRSGVRVIRPGIVVAEMAHTGSDHAEPDRRDLRL